LVFTAFDIVLRLGVLAFAFVVFFVAVFFFGALGTFAPSACA